MRRHWLFRMTRHILLGDKHPDRGSKKISEGLTAVILQDSDSVLSEMEDISGSDDDFGPSDDGYFV